MSTNIKKSFKLKKPITQDQQKELIELKKEVSLLKTELINLQMNYDFLQAIRKSN